jgi:hypothetical protein
MDLAQLCGLGFLAQIPNLKTPSRIINEKLKIKQGFFHLNLIKNSKEQHKKPRNVNFNLD